MIESNRVLNLDDDPVVEVTLRGNTYQIRQQRRSVIEKVLSVVFPKEDPRELSAEARMHELVEFSADTLAGTFPTFALILGVEETDPHYRETVAHLEEHLHFDKAQKVFEAWWELNRVEDFLYRAGNPLIPQARLQAAINTLNGAAETEAPTSNLTPISN